MEVTSPQNSSLTPSQQRAVTARGNVLVMAGAGTGKTKTLVERCLDCLERERAALDQLLIVTFTEAAAAEMRQRLRVQLEAKAAAQSTDEHWPKQLALFDVAHIGTLHSFCLRLVREHFYELGLDPQFVVLDEGEARQRANEALDAIFQSHYAGDDEFAVAVQNLIQIHGGGRDENIRQLVLRLHHYSQARPDAVGWLAAQLKNFSENAPRTWLRWLLDAVTAWRNEWQSALHSLEANPKAVELAKILSGSGNHFSRETAADIVVQILSADDDWPAKRKTVLRKPLEKLFSEAAFLGSLLAVKHDRDPLAEDWLWVRGQMTTLLRLAQQFTAAFSHQKLTDGVLDFHDLEQLALKLLWNFDKNKPTATAETWREKLAFVFVDEYQDINAAQDKIIQSLSRGLTGAETVTDGEPGPVKSPVKDNRFLVGDVKQSIYRFRLADPKIFRDYAHAWHGATGETIPLSENFRSREGLLKFVNSVCGMVMREEVGGVAYDREAELKFGSPATRKELSVDGDSSPRVELLLRHKTGRNETSEEAEGELADLDEAQKEARLVAMRLQQLVADQHPIWDEKAGALRPVEWRDMTILLRSPRGKSEIFAQEFQRANVPLAVARGGFYESSEILDLLSLLRLLDNPLQDVPCIAVLRSPLVGLSLDELAGIRLAAKGHFWTALNRFHALAGEVALAGEACGGHGEGHGSHSNSFKLFQKISRFLKRFSGWRKLARLQSLSQCLEEILDDTLYADWLRAQPRGTQRAANVFAFLTLAQQFDQFQRQGLFRFLKFVEAQQEAEVEPEVSPAAEGNQVRLMSIHQSKGLEFPVVVLADLAKNFNEQDLRAEIIFDEELGLCPKVKPPTSGRRYPSLPHWLAQRRQRRELRGEELRLLYVALTRARENLILTATVSEKNWDEVWSQPQFITAREIASARNFADWLAFWFSQHTNGTPATGGETTLLRWRLVEDAELGANADSRGDGEAEAEPIKSSEPAGISDGEDDSEETAALLREKLAWAYPHATATERKAKSSVTALRREAEELDDETEQVFSPNKIRRQTSPKAAQPNSRLSATQIGVAHHKFIQHVGLDKIGDLVAEADRLATENYLSTDERAALDLAALATFWQSDLGRKICAQATNVRRELPFTARFGPDELDQLLGRIAPSQPSAGQTNAGGIVKTHDHECRHYQQDEFVVVQGVADLIVLLPAEIWLVDFKTDEVNSAGLADKIKTYTPQLELYAAALERIFHRPVTLRALHFLTLGRTQAVGN